MPKKQVLGRGLDVLIPGMDPSQLGSADFFYCDIDTIKPNPYQPRRQFSEDELQSLAESIKANGVIQPLVVRSVPDGYELIVGERRWRAGKMAGLKQVPAVARDASALEMLEVALVENIHREDLNPLEKAEAYQRLMDEFDLTQEQVAGQAEAYQRLMDEFDLTQEQVAGRVGQSRSTVANFLRLRSLPQDIQGDIVNGTLSMGHARALLAAEKPAQQKAVWRQVVSKRLSVRATEELVKKLLKERKTHPPSPPSSEEIYLRSVADDLARHLGTKVHVVRKGKKGRLEIEFYGNDDLDRLVTLLKAS
jgi:ParB family chromosome partitioning protein